jgi:hypothetical protein
MTPEQFAKASPIIEALKRVANARIAAERAYNSFCEEEKKDLERDPERKATNGFSGGYNIIVATHSDGSGSRIDMSGCYVAKDIYLATMDVLIKKEMELKDMLAAV